jgi:hypothetical protein
MKNAGFVNLSYVKKGRVYTFHFFVSTGNIGLRSR